MSENTEIDVGKNESLDDLFYQIQAGELADAKESVGAVLADRIQAKLSELKKAIAGSLYKESVDEGDISADDKLAAVEKRAKSVPKKAPKIKDGDGKVVDEFKPFKEDLDETKHS